MTALIQRGLILQNAYVVRSLEDACARLNRLFGIGPFLGGGPSRLADHVYRGEPAAPADIRAVFAPSGDYVVELVELLSSGPSAFHDMYGGGGEGLHHIGIFCDDYAQEQARSAADGYPVASAFTTVFGTRICYVDARPALGHMIELYPEDATIRRMYRQAREATATWNGRDLIVPWPS
jgi:hypothetical protein